MAALMALLCLGCAELSQVSGPEGRSTASPPLMANGATKSYWEFTGSIDQDLSFSCLDEPARFVVQYTWTFSATTTPSGISSVRSLFVVDRSQSYVIYKGITYYVAQGRPGHDDIIHYLYGPDGLYVEAGVEPDFLRADTGERLRLNFTWHLVLGQDGTVRVAKFAGACPPL